MIVGGTFCVASTCLSIMHSSDLAWLCRETWARDYALASKFENFLRLNTAYSSWWSDSAPNGFLISAWPLIIPVLKVSGVALWEDVWSSTAESISVLVFALVLLWSSLSWLYFLTRTGWCLRKLLPPTIELTCHLLLSNVSYSFCSKSNYSLFLRADSWLMLPRKRSCIISIFFTERCSGLESSKVQ